MKVMVAAVLPEMLKETAMLGKSRVAVWNRSRKIDVGLGSAETRDFAMLRREVYDGTNKERTGGCLGRCSAFPCC